MIVLWLLTAIYAAARFLQLFPQTIPVELLLAAHIIPSLLFAVVHGARVYGARGILAFVAICLCVGFAFEEIGVATGLPFGRYYFTGAMGPKLGYVPVLLGLAYVGMGYLSWTLARLISGSRLTALLAAGIMTTWDLALEPIWSTVEHGWIWLDGGPWFGVPLLNFAGWMLTVFTFCQCFAWYARRHPERKAPESFTRVAIVFYLVSAFGNCLQVFRLRFHAPVMDAASHIWTVAPILQVCCLVSILAMGGFAALAWRKGSVAA